MKRHAHSGVVQRFFAFLAGHNLTSARVGVAFSGGADSAAAAICAAEAVRAGRLESALAIHVDHGVRPESGHEAAHAGAMSDAIGLPFRSAPLDLPPNAAEAAMRDARYTRLAGIAVEERLDLIITGHHQRDQAETVLLHLIRGTGLEGLAGMAQLERLPTDKVSLLIARPFLAEDPRDLGALVQQRGLEPIVDPSNLDVAFRRNFVRHEILPRLASINPDVERHISRCADIVSADDEFLDSHCASLLSNVAGEDWLDGAGLCAFHPAIQRRLIRLWIKRETDVEFSFDRVEAVRTAAIAGTGNVSIQIGDGWEVRQTNRRFTLHKTETRSEEHGVEP